MKIRSVRRGTLIVTVSHTGAGDSDLRKIIFASAFQIVSTGSIYDRSNEQQSWTFELRWRAFPHESDEPAFLQTLSHLEGFKSLNCAPRAYGRTWRSRPSVYFLQRRVPFARSQALMCALKILSHAELSACVWLVFALYSI